VNDVQPLVRYEIGDVGTWAAERCPCGRDHLPVLASVEGRQNDAIRTPDGRTICGCEEVFGVAEHIIEGQIIQEETGRFTLRIVPANGFDPAQGERVAEALRRRVGDVRVDFEIVDAIERSAAGKFRPVVSRLAGADLSVAECGGGPPSDRS
jgi:phenylacetate-CoA ligase